MEHHVLKRRKFDFVSIRLCGIRVWMNPQKVSNDGACDLQNEARLIRKTGRKIASSKEKAIRFLASTKMYSIKGHLKPQFG